MLKGARRTVLVITKDARYKTVMLDTIISWGVPISIFTILGLVIRLSFKSGGFFKEFSFLKERVKKVEEKAEEIEKKVVEEHDLIIELKTKVDLIYKFAQPNIPMKPSSPMALTPVGLEISKKIKAKEIFDRVKVVFISNFIKENAQNNAFEIQQNSIEWAKKDLKKLLTKEEIDIFDKESYNRGLLPEDVFSILGLYLMEEVFSSLNIDHVKSTNTIPKTHDSRSRTRKRVR